MENSDSKTLIEYLLEDDKPSMKRTILVNRIRSGMFSLVLSEPHHRGIFCALPINFPFRSGGFLYHQWHILLLPVRPATLVPPVEHP